MKITKIEQAQGGFVAGSGARPLSSRLDANAMAAPGQALAQLGNTISDIGQTWLEKELAIRNQQEVAKAKSHMSTIVENAREAVKTIPDPKLAEITFNSIVSAERQRVDKGGVEGLSFTTGTGRRSWRSETSTLIANGAKNVRATARTLMAETAVANTYMSLDELAEKRASATSESERLRFENDIRKEVEALRSFGYLDPIKALSTTKSYLSKSDTLLVEKQLLAAEEKDDPDAAEDVFNAIQDPAQYKNLDGEDRQNLSERALRLAGRLERKKQADEDRAERKAKRDIDKTQRKTFRTLATGIEKNRQDSKNPRPRLTQIIDAFGDGELSQSGYEKLIGMLEKSGDPIVVDQSVVRDFFKDIREAESEDALEQIVDRAYNQIGVKIDLATAQAIENRANGQTAKTPQARQARIFGNLLQTVAEPGGVLDQILPGAKEKAAVIQAQFEADIEDGVAVPEAFRAAVDALQKSQRANLRSMAAPRLGEASSKPMDEWTMEDVRQSRQATKTQFKGKPSSLALELFKLRVLENYINKKADADRANKEADDFEKANDR